MAPFAFFLLRLDWEVLRPITKVPHYQGMLWSALFRHAYNPWLIHDEPFHQTGLVLEPADFGVPEYDVGDQIALGLLVPVDEAMRLAQVLTRLDQAPGIHGQFEPGRTIQLSQVTCRLSGDPWPSPASRPIERSDLQPLVEHYRNLEKLKLWFHAPLRLTKPPRSKTGGRYCDLTFFREHPLAATHLTHALNLQTTLTLHSEACHGLWLDTTYGRENQKTIGGFTGVLTISSPNSESDLLGLLIASFCGIGKNRGFGLGVFRLDRRDHLLGLFPLPKQRRLFRLMLNRDALRATLKSMADASPGPDGITPSDLLLMGDAALDALCLDLKEGRYRPGGETTYQIPKADGGYRRLKSGNVVDRLLQKRAAQLFTSSIDHFLTEACYAYRKGFGRTRALAAMREAFAAGYQHGVKADIHAFFDTVDRSRLWSLLTALFPRESLLDLLAHWFPAIPESKGLPQDNPLSPLLSNLYLEAFDTALQRRGLKLIRYADDFVLLSREPIPPEMLQDWVAAALGPLKLTLAPHKTQAVGPGQKPVFLGYRVIDGEAVEEPEETHEAQWYPLQQSPSIRGQVVYLTARHQSTFNQGGNLVITTANGEHTAIPWPSIRTIVNIGRHRLSGSVLRRALNQKVPVFFQKLLGGMEGMLVPQPGFHQAPLMVLQQQRFSEEDTRLAWTRSILAAKICNRAVVLKRHGIDPKLRKATIIRQLEKAMDAAALRGIEGHYAATYFAAFTALVAPFTFTHRVYRPPDGPVNAMLSLGYMLLYHRVNAALIRAGLDSRCGFFHEGRGSHAALASDMMEELRFLADRTVVAVIRMGMIQPDDFEPDNRGRRARLKPKAFSIFVKRFEYVLAGTFQDDKTGKPLDYNAYIEDMAVKVCAALKLGVTYEPRWMR